MVFILCIMLRYFVFSINKLYYFVFCNFFVTDYYDQTLYKLSTEYAYDMIKIYLMNMMIHKN